MTTASTKSRDNKKASAQKTAQVASEAEPLKPALTEISPLVWRLASLAILLGAAFIRLYHLTLKPFHHDEGVNGFFLTNLYRTGVYHYDPTNYHGPTLYYFALATTKLNGLLFGQDAGLSTIAVRLVPVIFGVATVWLVLCLRRHIGTVGALAAAALVALSPGSVFFSRYFIHETHFVFFTLGIVVAFLNYYDRKRPTIAATSALALILLVLFVPSVQRFFLQLFPSVSAPVRAVLSILLGAGLTFAAIYALYADDEGKPIYLLLAFASAAFLFATKETAIISVGVLALALAVAAAYTHLFGRRLDAPWEKKSQPKKRKKKRNAPRKELLERFGGAVNVALWTSIALSLFVFINIVFYSSFFTYWEGVVGALDSLQVWAKTGTKEHAHDWYTYFIWLWQEEAPLLFTGAAGAVVALIRRMNRFAVFAGAWAFGMLAAYSLIPYKTPWLMLSFTVPLAIIGGYAINELYTYAEDLTLRVAAIGLLVVALVISGTQSVVLDFYHYDDDQYPYVYAHTRREFLTMVDEIDRLAERAGTGAETEIAIITPEYWPLPWYLRDYPHAAFWGKVMDESGRLIEPQGPIVVSSEKQELEESDPLQRALGGRYHRLNSYPMRPGVTLVLYVKNELAEP